MRFDVYGPHEIPRAQRGVISWTSQENKEFWGVIDEDLTSGRLSDACGCYVFTIKSGRTALPWYIGKAEKSSFKKECLNPRNINLYNQVLLNTKRGRPNLYLLPQVTEKGKFKKPAGTDVKRPEISALESILIGMGIAKNPNLLNVRGTKMLREIEVIGFLNSDRRQGGATAAELRKLLSRA